MANYSGGARAVCPYYLREAQLSITCEGIGICSNLMMRFDSKMDKEGWQSTVCETFEFHACPVAAMVDAKYRG